MCRYDVPTRALVTSWDRAVIKQFHVENFKALRDVTVDLTPFHVLIGPNDSGKTSILQAIAGLLRTVDEDNHRWFPGLWSGRDLVWRGTRRSTVALRVNVDLNGINAGYGVTLGFPDTGRNVEVVDEVLSLDAKSITLRHQSARTFLWLDGVSTQSDPPPGTNREQIDALRESLRGVHAYRWDPRFLGLPTAPDSRWRFRLHTTGFGLPRCLDDILGHDRRRFDQLEERFTMFFPEFKSIKLPSQKAYVTEEFPTTDLPRLEPREGKGISFEMASGGELPASQVSDGVLLVLAYLCILHLPQPPRLLLIEEPENGIHPTRLQQVISMLRELIEEHRTTQLLMTTHSPYVLDLMKPDEVTLCHKGKDGAVKTRRLSTVPTVLRQLDIFGLGEIWTAEGDEALATDQAVETEKA